MRLVIICIFMSLVACGSSGGGDLGPSAKSPDAPSPGSPDPIAPDIVDAEYLSFGVYTGLDYCDDVTCTYASPPTVNCNSVFSDVPGDFDLTSLSNGAFFHSVYENVNIGSGTVSFLSADSGHQGWSFDYEYLGNGRWQVMFTSLCGRIYKKAGTP